MGGVIIIINLLIIPGLILALEKEPLKEELIPSLEKVPLIEDLEEIEELDPIESLSKRVKPKFKVQSSRFKVQGSKFKAQGSRFKTRMTKRPGVTTLREGVSSLNYPKEEKVITVGEIVEDLIPQVLKDRENPSSLTLLNDQEENKPLQLKDESFKEATPPITQKRSHAKPDVKSKGRIEIIMSGIGLAGLLGFGVGILIRRFLKSRKTFSSNNRAILEEGEIEDLRSYSIYKGWWQDDIKNLQKTYKEEIQDLGERLKMKILTIEDTQSKLSRSVTEIEERLEGLSSLISNTKRSKKRKATLRPSFEEVLRLSRDGLDINEIAQKTRVGKGEVELILKTYVERVGVKSRGW